MGSLLPPDAWVRLPFYAALGIVLEIFFTATMDLLWPNYLKSWNAFGRGPVSATRPDWAVPGVDVRARGYTFLWMLPIYALMLFLEPIHHSIAHWPWFLRGLLYLVLVWIAEFMTGWIVEKITGKCPWDYRYSKYSVCGLIRWDFAPVWFLFGFIFEYFHPRLVALTPYLKEQFF